jgi:hypothetical protein
MSQPRQLPYSRDRLEDFLDFVTDAFRELVGLPMDAEVNYRLGLEGKTVTVILRPESST